MAIQDALGIDVELKAGGPGQLDVVVDGETVATREKGFWKRLLGGGFPEPGAVVAALRQRLNG